MKIVKCKNCKYHKNKETECTHCLNFYLYKKPRAIKCKYCGQEIEREHRGSKKRYSCYGCKTIRKKLRSHKWYKKLNP